MKKEVTLDELARMIQDEFVAVRGEMRQGFDAVHKTLKNHDDRLIRVQEDVQILRRDMEAGFTSLALILKPMQEDIRDLKKMDIEILELRGRVERLEAKLGITG